MHPAVSATLIMAFSISIVGLVLSFGLPLIEDKTNGLDIEGGKSAVNHLSEVMLDLSDDPIGTSREVDLAFSKGHIVLSGSELCFILGEERYCRTFSGLNFGELDIPSGQRRVNLEKVSSREIHVTLE
ncbi:MAG: hypothetical protein JW727_05200 [Candidatus Aenigmarchaeota archaeon]|nr:hypothetical protein [Candidatus Aenigmarchaeota archaeon]